MEETIEEKDKFKDIFSTSKRALGLAWKQERKLFLSTLILTVILAAVTYAQLASFSNIVNEIVRMQKLSLGITSVLVKQAIFLGFSFLIPTVLQNLLSRDSTALSIRMGTHNQLLQVDSYSGLDIGTIQGTEFQTKRDRALKWGTGSINNVVHHSESVLKDITSFIVAGFLLYSINPLLVLLAIAGSVSYYFVEKKYGKALWNAYYISTDEVRIEAEKFSHFKDPKKIIEVLLFNIKKLFRSQILDINQQYDTKVIRLKKKQSFAILLADIMQILCLFIAIFFVTQQTLSGKLLIGSLLLAFGVYRSFVQVSQNFFQDFSRLEQQSRFAKRWFDIFDMKSKIVSKPDAVKPQWQIPPRIEFKNVSFRYPEGEIDVLKNISFVLESGEKMAMVGLNGAGKTTLVKLLCRVYDPTEGQVLVDGVDLKDIDLEYWYENLGVLFQDFSDYKLTVREAIAISRPNKPISLSHHR